MAFDTRAVARYVRMSPQKVRLVADRVRGMLVVDALAVLEHMPQAAARPMYKVIRSAVANAEENFGVDPGDLYITKLTVDGAPMMKRWRAGARGRYKPVLKRSSHITVVLEEVEE
ncbi:MAG: 50S ribosomal protein L22 [Chloroflexota bacterium]|nr:50S ribosomal protein L22 [Chloroflexota bacterium]